MQHPEHFKQFLENIGLNKSRMDRINGALEVMEAFLEDQEALQGIWRRMLIQGSFALGTGIRPVRRSDYDVDIVIEHLTTGETPEQYVERLYRAFRADARYEGKVSRRPRCVRVTYAEGFHVDLVCAVDNPADVGLLIANRQEDDWEPTNPAGFIAWFRRQDGQAFGRLKTIVKAIKYFRDLKGTFTCPSILLTVIFGSTIVPGDLGRYGDEEFAFYSSVVDVNAWLDEFEERPSVLNPSLPDEDLASRHWTDQQYQNFKERMRSLQEALEEAIQEEDEAKSLDKWQAIFGDKYPRELHEIATASKAFREGRLDITPGGGLAVLPHPSNRTPAVAVGCKFTQ